MAHPTPAFRLVDAFRPLAGAFGERLAFSRDGSVARWSYNGQVAIVELTGDDRAIARFVAPAGVDAVSGLPADAVYARDERGYALTQAGCERMVADMLAFFSGSREPAFTFVSAS